MTDHLAEHYVSIEGKYLNKAVKCTLCPNYCVIGDRMQGICRVRMNMGGKLYSMVYGKPCSINIDPIEKKPLYHYYPGGKILSIGTFGCNLRCKGCQNFDITMSDFTKSIQGLENYNPEKIIELAIENDSRMIAYTYNEPTVFFEYMKDIARIARKNKIKNVIVSNGYINKGPLKELCRYIDAANIDVKGITEKFYSEYSMARLKPVLDTVKTLYDSKKWLELTNLIIPRLNDSHEEIGLLCKWIVRSVGRDVPLHVSRFYPHYKASGIPPTEAKILMHAKSIAREAGIRYVYVGNLGILNDTNCTKCNSPLISRSRGVVKMFGLEGTSGNECSKCKKILPGVFV